MKRSGEKILADIDATLDQLIQNADVMQNVPVASLDESEIEALQKTQESLLAHLIHIEQRLDNDQKKAEIRKKTERYTHIQQKIIHYSRLNERLMRNMESRFGVNAIKAKKKMSKRTRIGRNRKRTSVACIKN